MHHYSYTIYGFFHGSLDLGDIDYVFYSICHIIEHSYTHPIHFYAHIWIFFHWGSSLGFIMGGGVPSTSTILMRDPTSSGVVLPFGWNIPSGFRAFPSQYGDVICQYDLTSHDLSHLSLGDIPWGKFS
jgi:hypothetical protein